MNSARATEPATAAPSPPRLVGPLIGLWLLTIVAGGLVGGYALPRCAENLPPGVVLAAALSAIIAAWLVWRRRMKSWWVLLLALAYGGFAWLTIALSIAIGNFLASGLCRLF